MNLHDAVEELISKLKRRFGSISQCGKSRIYQFGNQITCSINYSKLLQTTKHPKLNISEFLNAFPEPNAKPTQAPGAPDEDRTSTPVDRVHVKIQWNLIKLGCAEGCTVWVPRNDLGKLQDGFSSVFMLSRSRRSRSRWGFIYCEFSTRMAGLGSIPRCVRWSA